MKTLEFWRDRFFFFIVIWAFTMAVASFIIIISAGGVNATYWDMIQSVSLRAFFNFSAYIILFSIVIEWLSPRLPYRGKQLWLRLLISSSVILFAAYNSAIIGSFFPVPDPMKPIKDNFLFVFIISFFQSGMIFTTLEFWGMMKRNRQLEISITQLEKEKIQSQLQALRQQVNPHFLFNSLNVLSELVHEDLDKTDQFIDHFAKVYRYVLEINQEHVVTLKKEFDFLESYIFLQQIRFGGSLNVETHLPSSAMQKYIPPLSLQILFENIIKHNIITPQAPLNIEISCTDDQLQMINNFQELKVSANGTGVGLKNLKQKYQLISRQSPNFYIKNGFYIAELPLINIEE